MTPSSCAEAVARLRGCTVEQMRADRVGPIAAARQQAMWLALRLGCSSPQVGAFWGRNHTTALYARDRVDEALEDAPRVAAELGCLLHELRPAVEAAPEPEPPPPPARVLPWQSADDPRACCRPGVDPEIFFAGSADGERKSQPPGYDPYAAARAVCDGCGLRARCLEYGLERDIRDGFFGGLDPWERQRLQRGRAA